MPRKAIVRKRAYDGEATRTRILDVAADQFQARGYHATSMHDLMDLAGVPGGSMYHCFPTKRSLGLAVISERVAAAVSETWIEPVRSARSARAGILGVFDRVAKSLTRSGTVYGCPVSNLALELSLVDPSFQKPLAKIFDAWSDALSERIRADVRAGVLRGVEPDIAPTIVAMFSGAMTMAKAQQSAKPLAACRRQIARFFAAS